MFVAVQRGLILGENIMSIQERIEKLEKELAEIKAELNKPREYEKEFKCGEYYYSISSNNGVEESEWEDDNIDNFRLSIGNAFHTKKEAEAHKQRLIVHNKLKQIAKRLNNGVEIDWKTPDCKWHLSLDLGETINHHYNQQFKIGGATYCLSKDFQDVAIQEIGEEALVDYLKYGI